MSSYQIAQLLFPDDEVKKLGREQRTVGSYLDAVKKRKREENRAERNKYDGPKNIAECIDRVNLYTDAGLVEGEMKAMEKKIHRITI